jgi:hypothetical protein
LAAFFVLGALKNNLNTVSFALLCHLSARLNVTNMSFCFGGDQSSLDTNLIDKAEASGGDTQLNPAVFGGKEEFLIKEVWLEAPLCSPF